MEEKQKIFCICPLCQKTINFDINKALILNSNKHLNPFIIEHCGKTLLTHIDTNFKCRSMQLVFNAINK